MLCHVFRQSTTLSIVALVILSVFLFGQLSSTLITGNPGQYEEREYDEELRDSEEDKKGGLEYFPLGYIQNPILSKSFSGQIVGSISTRYFLTAKGSTVPFYIAYCRLLLDC